jgi:hypothetical protein
MLYPLQTMFAHACADVQELDNYLWRLTHEMNRLPFSLALTHLRFVADPQTPKLSEARAWEYVHAFISIIY